MHYHLPLYRSLPANGQETNWEPQPGSSITIACDNRCVILSSTLQPPLRCVITGDCHNLVPSHGEASDLNCSALNLENVSCQVLILYEHWGISVDLMQLSLMLLTKRFLVIFILTLTIKLRFLEEWNKRKFAFYVLFVIGAYFWSAHSNVSKKRWDR